MGTPSTENTQAQQAREAKALKAKEAREAKAKAQAEKEQQEKEQQEKEQELELHSELLDGWDTFTKEQQENLTASLLKSKAGIGGESFSTFPTLMVDKTTNIWVSEKYNPKKLPNRVTEKTFKEWQNNGELQILPLIKGKWVHYLTIIKPHKDITLDIWELDKLDIKPYQEYHTHNLLGQLTITNNHYHILNSYTNKNKAYNQSNLLVKLFKLGTIPSILEGQKDLNTNHLQMDILDGKFIFREISKNTQQPNGKIFHTIGEYIGREKLPNNPINFLEHIN